MLQHLISHFLLHYMLSGHLREVKNKGKFQAFSSESGCSRLQENGRVQEVPNMVI